jgi:SAM-dependent methyltransferase
VPQLYDRIGAGYKAHRRPDPRIGAAILHALGPAGSVVNVGAGAGSYEPTDRPVVAVEPSPTMIRQRPPGSAPVVQASATALPFRDGAFDAALAVLTVHHWPDRARGLGELQRVAGDRAVILTWEPDAARFWLVDDYFPALATLDRAIFDTLDDLRRILGPVEIQPLPIPHDCWTASWAPTGAGPTPIWTRPSAARSPRSARSVTWSPASRGCGATWPTAPGSGGTVICWSARPSTWATASSSLETL